MLNIQLERELERLVDATSLSRVINALRAVCAGKADHLEANWQDGDSARAWEQMANRLATQWDACRRKGI